MMGARGERFIETKEGEIRLLFTNQALAEAEARMDKSILGCARDLLNGQAGIGEVAQLLRVGMQASNQDEGRKKTVPLQRAYQIMDEVGFTTVMTDVLEGITAVLMYKGEQEDEDPNS